ncbi:uncharacterized protein LDX57_005141 [Aspergillus melleus]|uniref:uncharacterized protein n=1 Tax=Aspergillus melleus TaxID=138277 RepID=UPI001E8D32C2|nr:uncharacterized protein LDX57_005141 [Aspergillus melleus]KAH8427427.1 hypothetical protein LDX57_005141 [Aspergillus melleus]
MATAQLPAGSVPRGLPTKEEIQEYEKILKISDDIFSGTHPRLKVPQQFVRKAAVRNQPAPNQAQVKPGDQPVSSSPGNNRPQSAATTPTIPPDTQGPNAGHAASSLAASSRVMPRPTSEIDPIFLTKSDDLVRAELQLQRQRVERSLRDQLDQKRQESRQKASIQDAKPDFDVSEVLQKAFEMVNPSPSVDAPGAGQSSDSFDDNSFYSSRAPDSPQNGDQEGPSPKRPIHQELATEVQREPYSDELQRLEALNRPESDQDMQDTYPVADARLPYQHQRPSRYVDTEYMPGPRYQALPAAADALEEPEYSPPAPGVAPMERETGHEYHPRGYPSGPKRRGPQDNRPDRGRYPRRSISPGDDVRVVRNHITSPAAPQPSRVSPLAIAKVPSVHQTKDSRSEYAPEGQASPDGPAPQPLASRKRRRLHGEKDKTRTVSHRMQPGRSDEPYIKEEPVSPPPFADTPPSYRSRQPQERPVYIDIASPRYTPVVERREPPIREPAYELDPYEYPGETIPRTLSRVSARRPMRDDQDLRRVASLHHSRQQEYPREYVDPASPRGMRAASYAVLERPQQERARYYDEVAPPPTRRYIAAGEASSSPQYREAYYEEEPASRIMAPPTTRRIVVDEQGNHYYETVPAPRMQPMPPPTSRVPRSEVYDDAPQMRQASVRAASVLEDPYGGRRYMQEMPPPQGVYRRVTDYARPAPSDRRSYVAPLDERETFPRSASVQVGDYTSRRPPYVEEAELPRERVVRIPSVRPPTARYEEPREMLPRVESVRPGGRDMSVYMDEDVRRPREYIERPLYVAARPLARAEGFYESGEPERVMLDSGVHRVSQRY